MNLRAESVRTAQAAWERARLYDDKMGSPDAGRLSVWAESIEKHGLEARDALDAVTRHYESTGNTIQISDVIRQGRMSRLDRTERDKASGGFSAEYLAGDDKGSKPRCPECSRLFHPKHPPKRRTHDGSILPCQDCQVDGAVA